MSTTSTQGNDIADVSKIPDDKFIDSCRIALQSAEQIRIKNLKAFQFRGKICYPSFVVLLVVGIFMDSWVLTLTGKEIDGASAVIAILVFCCLAAWLTSPKRQYASAYKYTILPEVTKVFGGLTYKIDGQIPMEDLKPSDIVPKHSLYNSEDYFSGHYKGVNLSFSEIDLEERHRTKDETRYVSVFKGLAILLSMENKKFYGHTILKKDQSKAAKWVLQKTNKTLKRANFVDPEFEDLFDAYTNDQVEARYLIDPKIMERYKDLHQHYNSKDMRVAYFDDKVFILIESKSKHFEPADLYTPATDEDSLLQMKQEVQDILSIIDYLDLYDPAQAHNNAES
jgi:hypothetical protein